MNQSDPDTVFARDLIQFVMQFHRPTWKFSNEFAIEADNSNFTETFANYIQTFIRENDVNIQKDYEEAFEGKDITDDLFQSVGKSLMFEFFDGGLNFCEMRFIAYCGILSKYTVLSHIFGLSNAPIHAVNVISETLKYLRHLRKFTDESRTSIEMYMNCQ